MRYQNEQRETLCDRTQSRFPFQVWGQGDAGCLLSWLDDGRAAMLFFDSELSGPAFTKWVEELDQKVRALYSRAKQAVIRVAVLIH